jgi:hypothetical protein
MAQVLAGAAWHASMGLQHGFQATIDETREYGMEARVLIEEVRAELGLLRDQEARSFRCSQRDRAEAERQKREGAGVIDFATARDRVLAKRRNAQREAL